MELAYVLAQKTMMGERGLWMASPASNIIVALITMGIYAKGDWKKKRLTEEEDELSKKVTEETLTEEGMHR